MLYVAIWYVSIRPVVMRVKEELLCSSSFTLITTDIPNCNIQHKNAPEDGLFKSETYRVTECYE